MTNQKTWEVKEIRKNTRTALYKVDSTATDGSSRYVLQQGGKLYGFRTFENLTTPNIKQTQIYNNLTTVIKIVVDGMAKIVEIIDKAVKLTNFVLDTVKNLLVTVKKAAKATTKEVATVAPNAQISLDTIAEVANIAEVAETTTAETHKTPEKPTKKYNIGENITLINSWKNKYVASKFWRLCDNDNFQYTLRLQADGDLYLTHGNKFYPVGNINQKDEPNRDKTQNYSKLVEIFKDYKQSQVIGNIHYYTDVLKRKNGKLTKTQAEKLAYFLKIAKREKYEYDNSFSFENLPSWKLPKVA
ncbi:MAG: hypothetical protein FWG64_04720 [Firmicutes bacterium]|nr:hypothetical protein [Bacillota bacterium]